MRLFDVTGFDDPSTSGVNEGEAVVTNSTGTAIFHHVTATEPVVSGSGLYDPFLRQDHNSGTSLGYNSNENGNPANTNSANTSALMLSDIPIVMRDGVAYYEFRLDVNEPNNSGSTNPDLDPGFVSLEQLKIYVSGREANVTDYSGGFASSDFGLVYDLDATEDTRLRLDDSYPGSGRDDYIMWIPVTEFQSQLAPGQDAADTYVTFFSQFGPTPSEDGGFEEWRVQDVASIKGIKFNDVNGNGVRDAGEQGLAGFTIYVDANNNNQYDVGELSTVTKADGSFSFYGFPVKDAPYNVVIREAMTDTQLGSYLLTTGDSSGDHVVMISAEQAYAVSVGNMPIITDFSLTKTVNTIVDGPDNGIGTQLDGAGDKVDFLISIVNTGNVALTNVNLSDLLEGTTALGYTLVSNGNGDAVLNVGEEWIFRTDFYTITQNDLDNRGGGDGDIDNVANATANYLTKVIGPRSDDASVPLVYNPDVSIVKSVTSISGGNGNAVADWAGDRINYQIVVKNEGNISLTGVSLTDINAAGLTLASGDTDGDLVLDVGETWTYTAYHDVTQEELDGKGTNDLGVIDGDGDTDNTATVDTDQTDPESSTVYTPLVYNPDLSIVKSVTSISGGNGNAVADWAGDRINYQIVVKNEGNISLTGVSLTDINAAGLTLASGDTDGDLVLDVGETWTYTAYHDVTQEELDGKGTNDLGVIDGDGDTDNTATVDTDQTDPESSTVYTPLVYNPDLSIVKSVTSISGGNGNAVADWAGDRINYQIVVKNEGNISLTGVSLTDINAAGLTLASGDTDGDLVLDVGETWTYTAYHDVTQEELDGKGTNDLGVIDGDGDTDNTATVDTDQTDPESSTVYTPLVYNPAVDLEKYVSVDGGTTWQDADVTTGPTASVNAPVLFQITIVNTGNITLTGITLTDQLVNATNGTTSPIDLSGYVLVESGTQDGKLDVGESATLTYSLPFAAGQHTNVATVTTNQGATDSDAANYWGMHNTGPGVRTPGFWSNLGFTFWDGIEGNEPKQAGTPGFADGELLYRVDSDGDGDIDGYDKAGLLIGDFDHDGYRSAGEDVIFISLSQAQQLINASNKTISSDWIWKLGRDTVATWLNGLAGNYLGTASDPQSPTHYLDDAVDWFQRYAGTTNSPFDEVFDVFRFGPSVKNGLTSAGDHNASQIHNALDYYNNNGMTQAGGTVYAGDADSNSFLFALSSLPPLMA